MDLFIKVENAKWTNFDSTSYNFLGFGNSIHDQYEHDI